MIDPSIREEGPALTDSTLRQFAGLWAVLFGGLGIYQGIFRDRPLLGLLLWAVAVVAGLPGILRPQTLRPLFATAMALARPIGFVVSHVLLGFLFYVVMTPLAFVFRLRGRDALGRRPARAVGTYWIQRKPSDDPRRYFRQS